MIVLRVIPLARRYELGRHLAFPPLLVDLLRNVLSNLFLLVIVVKDSRSVLRAVIGTLTVLLRWIVHLVEELEQCAVLNLLRVEDDL